MSSKRKIRNENTREPRKKQAVEEQEVISLLTPEKPQNSTSDEKKKEMEGQNNAQHHNHDNTNNTNNKNDQENGSKQPQEDPQCGICLDKPTVQGELDSCTHIFCFECIEHWSKTANTCPFCKARFKSLTKLDLQNPANNKKLKKVRVRHADQRPDCEDPEQWIVWEGEDDDEYDEDGWMDDDDTGAWGFPLVIPQRLSGSFWAGFMEGSLPDDFDSEADDFIDDYGAHDDFIDLTGEPDEIEDVDESSDELDDEDDISSIDISALVRQVFHPFARGSVPAPIRSAPRASQSSRIRSMQTQLRNSRSRSRSNRSNNNNNTNISNNNNNNNTQRDNSSISGRTRSHSSNDSNSRSRRSNSNNQRNNSNNRRRS